MVLKIVIFITRVIVGLRARVVCALWAGLKQINYPTQSDFYVISFLVIVVST